MARAHTKAQGKNMTLAKRENCSVVKCFKTEYEFRQWAHLKTYSTADNLQLNVGPISAFGQKDRNVRWPYRSTAK